MSARPLAFTNVRLVDPATRYDGPGALLVKNGAIADVIQGEAAKFGEDIEVVDGQGAMLAPGLIDIRVRLLSSTSSCAARATSA
jgi:dihydroorotase